MNQPVSGNSDHYILETVDISRYFGAVAAVDSLSISIPRQGVTSIVGPNGSGKSTLINLLSGTLPLDGGMVKIDGLGLTTIPCLWRRRTTASPAPSRKCGCSTRLASWTTYWWC